MKIINIKMSNPRYNFSCTEKYKPVAKSQPVIINDKKLMICYN